MQKDRKIDRTRWKTKHQMELLLLWDWKLIYIHIIHTYIEKHASRALYSNTSGESPINFGRARFFRVSRKPEIEDIVSRKLREYSFFTQGENIVARLWEVTHTHYRYMYTHTHTQHYYRLCIVVYSRCTFCKESSICVPRTVNIFIRVLFFEKLFCKVHTKRECTERSAL